MSTEPTRVRWRSLALDPECVLGPMARLAVCALAENMGGRECYVSVPTIAARMGANERTAYRALDELEREGFVDVERRAGITNRYWRALPPMTLSHGSTPAKTPAKTPATEADEPDNQIRRKPSPTARKRAQGGNARARLEARGQETRAKELVAGYVAGLRERGATANRRLVGQVAARVGELVDDGTPAPTIKVALELLIDRRLNPTNLASLVTEAELGPRGSDDDDEWGDVDAYDA